MELRHLRYFLAVAETLNISEASRRLRVAQPSLSRQIRDLEFEVGHPLFRRIKGRLSLTDAGNVLRKRAAIVIRQAEDALAQTRAAGKGSTGELRVGYYGMMWATVIAAAATEFRRRFANISVSYTELVPAQIMDEVKNGRLDIAVLGHGTERGGREVEVTKIASVSALVAISSEDPLSRRRVLSLGELRDRRFLSYAPGYAPGRDKSFLKACRALGFKPNLVCEASGLPALLLAVAENRGLAVVSPFAPRAPHPGVVFARLRPPGVLFDIYVTHRHDLAPIGRRLAEFIVEVSRRDLLKQA